MLRSPPEPESEEISLYITTYYSLLRSIGRGAGPRVRGGARLQRLEPARGRARGRARPLRVRLCGSAPPRRHARRRSRHPRPVARALRGRRLRRPPAGRSPRRAAAAARCATTATASSPSSSRARATSTTSSRSSPPTRSSGTRFTSGSARVAPSPEAMVEATKDPVALAAALGVPGRRRAEAPRRLRPDAPRARRSRALRSPARPPRAHARGVVLAVPARGAALVERHRARLRARPREPRRPPVYFVSSNTHALANLVGGYARAHADEIVAWARPATPRASATRSRASPRWTIRRSSRRSSTTCCARTSTPTPARRR